MNPICPYCNLESKYVDSIVVYSKSYGMIYLCAPCKSWVGVHKGTNIPLGRLANAELREAKKIAHYYFDQLWRRKIKNGYSKNKARGMAYKWLSERMNIREDDCHIGMFDINKCNTVIEICKPYTK